MKVLRLTRHNAEPVQVAELQRIYGSDIEIVSISETLPSDTKSAVARFDEMAIGFNIVECVLPINLLEAVMKFSKFVTVDHGTIIRAVTNRSLDNAGNAIFTFSHYEKIVKVEVITERL